MSDESNEKQHPSLEDAQSVVMETLEQTKLTTPKTIAKKNIHRTMFNEFRRILNIPVAYNQEEINALIQDQECRLKK